MARVSNDNICDVVKSHVKDSINATSTAVEGAGRDTLKGGRTSSVVVQDGSIGGV